MSPAQIPFSPELLRLITIQDGVLSYQQACALLSRQSVHQLRERGVWQPLTRGIIAVTPQLTWRSHAWAGVLAGGPHAAVGGLAALHLAGVLDSPPPRIRIFTPAQVSRRIEGVRFVRTWRVGRGEPPRTGVSRSLIDAWGECGPGEYEILLGRALQFRRTSVDELKKLVDGEVTLRRRQQLLELLGVQESGSRSPLESRYLHDVERAHALPQMQRQARLPGGSADGYYPEQGVAVELDGRRYHPDQARDRRRDNLNATHGIVTLRFGWAEVTGDPCSIARRVAAVLRSRGWVGELRPCPRCQAG